MEVQHFGLSISFLAHGLFTVPTAYSSIDYNVVVRLSHCLEIHSV